MHEFSITSQIVNTVLKKADEHSAKKVVEVYLIIGKLTFLGLEQVKFAYDILVKGTIMENSKLTIEEQKDIVKCDNCGYEGDLKYENDPLYHISVPTLNCPTCGSQVKIIFGKECTIKSIRMMI